MLALPRGEHEPPSINDLADNLGEESGIALQGVSPVVPKPQPTLVVILNPGWRVVVIHDDAAWRHPTWMVQQLSDGAWHDRFPTRSADMLRWFMPRCGRISPDAKKVLAALPARVDQTGERRSGYQRKREQGSSAIAAAEPADDLSKKPGAPARAAELTQRFLQWRRDHLSPSPAHRGR